MEQPYVSFELSTGAPGIHIPPAVLVRWTGLGRPLTIEEADRLAAALDDSPVPDAVAEIVAGLRES